MLGTWPSLRQGVLNFGLFFGSPGFFRPFLDPGRIADFKFLVDEAENSVERFFNPCIALSMHAGCTPFPAAWCEVPFGPFLPDGHVCLHGSGDDLSTPFVLQEELPGQSNHD